MIEISNEYKNVDIKFRPISTEEDVIQNIKFILASVKEKNPLARDLGLEGIVDSKGVAGSGYERKIIEALEKYEPRFLVSEVEVKYRTQGVWDMVVRGDIVVY